MRRVLFPRPVKTPKGKKSALRSAATSADAGSSSLDAFAKTAANESTKSSTRSGAGGRGGTPRKPTPATSAHSASTSTEDDADEGQLEPASSPEPSGGGDAHDGDDYVEALYEGRAVRMPRAAVLAATPVEAVRTAKYARLAVQVAVEKAAAAASAPDTPTDAAALAALQAVVSSTLPTVVCCILFVGATYSGDGSLELGTRPDQSSHPIPPARRWGTTHNNEYSLILIITQS